MNEMTLSHNLQQLMRVYGNLSVTELANLTHIPQPTLHHILSGSTKNPRKKALEALSQYFSVSIDQLIGKASLPNVIPDTVKENLQITTVPIIDWDMLKSWPLTDVSNLHLKEILLDKKTANNFFALVIQDSSMEPMYPKNTLLIFDQGKNPKDRDFVIVHTGRDNEVLFNRLFTEDSEEYLKQNLDDGNFKLIKLNKKSDRIIGTLIEARIQY